jgi:two-component system probable response regulator PhcQ
MTEVTETQVPPLILFVDDEVTAVKYFQRAVGTLAPVIVATSVEQGKQVVDLHADTLMVVISDQRMPGQSGNKLLSYVRESYPYMVRILTTAYAELDETVDAINQGQIHRYLHKPWDIATLRMELRQALELANIRKEHAQLLREKLGAMQRQLAATRVGQLHTLCTALIGVEGARPVESYLAAARLVGTQTPEVDWQQMDYVDLVAAEANRSGRFAYALRARLAEIQKNHAQYPVDKALDVLLALLPDRSFYSAGETGVMLAEGDILVEFLETSSDVDVSSAHVAWVAFLLWLDIAGGALIVERAGAGLLCRLVPQVAVPSPRLATWIEQFSAI